MLINTVHVILCLTCFTTTAAEHITIEINNCNVTTVANRTACVYNTGDFLRLSCLYKTANADVSLTRYKGTSIISVFEYHHTQVSQSFTKISVSQYFTEQTDGEIWNCRAKIPNGHEENVSLLFKLHKGPSQMVQVSDTVPGNTNTIVWIAVGCCSLVSLLAVIAAVVTVRRVKAERLLVRRESRGPPAVFMYKSSSPDAEDIFENIYNKPNEATYDERTLAIYSNTAELEELHVPTKRNVNLY